MANIDLKELELVYRNAETQEELDLALQFHGMSSSELYRLASDRGWETSPIAAKNLAAQVDALPNAAPADEKYQPRLPNIPQRCGVDKAHRPATL